MTYIPVQGGLGNQLFIFAMAHYLEEEFDLDVVLTFKRDKHNEGHRDNYLEEFLENCTHNITIKDGSMLNRFLRIIDKIDSLSPSTARSLKLLSKFVDFHEPEEFKSPNLRRSRIIRGFFQSSELVDQVWPKLRAEFAKTIQLEHERMINNMEISELRNQDEYQCIHIRRGDYLENSKTIGVLSEEYFRRNASSEMRTIITTDTFDETSFGAEFSNLVLLNQNAINPVQAVAIMSYSNRLIMSNSTLSWWGSRLALENGGSVIAPRPWFISREANSRHILHDARFKYSESIFESR
jgi:hypothetical protein